MPFVNGRKFVVGLEQITFSLTEASLWAAHFHLLVRQIQTLVSLLLITFGVWSKAGLLTCLGVISPLCYTSWWPPSASCLVLSSFWRWRSPGMWHRLTWRLSVVPNSLTNQKLASRFQLLTFLATRLFWNVGFSSSRHRPPYGKWVKKSACQVGRELLSCNHKVLIGVRSLTTITPLHSTFIQSGTSGSP